MRDDTCDICGGRGRLWTRRRDRELLRCPGCGFAWVPQGVLRTTRGQSIYEDEAGELFETQADYYHDASAREAAAAKLEWVLEFSRPGGRLLDVGANAGDFVEEARPHYGAAGIEPSPAAVRRASERGRKEVTKGSIYDTTPALEGTFNVITMFDVIEHLPDPRRAVEQCRRYLESGGRLFVTTPDSGSAIARAMGARWHYLDLDQHISIFSAANLSRLLAQNGFTVLSQRTFGRRYRCSYIERRLGELGHGNPLLRIVHAVALPLKLVPNRRVTLNLGDVVGIVAERDERT